MKTAYDVNVRINLTKANLLAQVSRMNMVLKRILPTSITSNNLTLQTHSDYRMLYMTPKLNCKFAIPPFCFIVAIKPSFKLRQSFTDIASNSEGHTVN